MVKPGEQIRPYEQADEPFLWEVLYEALYRPPEQPPFDREILQHPDIRKYLSDFGRMGDEAFVLEVEGKQAGACWIRQFEADAPGYGFVDSRTPELTRLLDFANNALTMAGIAQISLSVDKRSPAVRLYQRLGYETLSDLDTAFTMIIHLPSTNTR